MSLVTRFAPSPTGHLHLGSAHAAFVAWHAAREGGGRFLLRIEDIDTQRCRADYVGSIVEDLIWLGLDWDGEIRIQTDHLGDYQAAIETLKARRLVYPCFCSRADIAAAGAAPHSPEGAIYPGTCRHLSPAVLMQRLAEPHAWRLDMAAALAQVVAPLTFTEQGIQRACDPARFGDVVLERRDTPGSYHLCVTHDDHLQGITLVTRGDDLLDATDVHRLIQALMGWSVPAYAHHALLLDAQGVRLAKRSDATSIRALRNAGMTPEAVRTMSGVSNE